jgi:hypothetical protein
MPFDKKALMNAVIAAMDFECETLASAIRVAIDGATNDQSKPENKYDTRALEASYLAGAQAERLRELKGSREFLASLPLKNFHHDESIGASAIVELALENQRIYYFFLPHGGGHAVMTEDRKLTTLTPQSPIGRAINGKRAGDDVFVEIQGKERLYSIVGVW